MNTLLHNKISVNGCLLENQELLLYFYFFVWGGGREREREREREGGQVAKSSCISISA